MQWWVTPLINNNDPDLTPIIPRMMDDAAQDIYGPPPAGAPEYEPGMLHPSATNAWSFPGDAPEAAVCVPDGAPDTSPPSNSACAAAGCPGKLMVDGTPHIDPCVTTPCPDFFYSNLGCTGSFFPVLGKIFKRQPPMFGTSGDWGIIHELQISRVTYQQHVNGTVEMLAQQYTVYNIFGGGTGMPQLRIDATLHSLLPDQFKVAMPVPSAGDMSGFAYPCHRTVETCSNQWDGGWAFRYDHCRAGSCGRTTMTGITAAQCKHDYTQYSVRYAFRWWPIVIRNMSPVTFPGGLIPIVTTGGFIGGILLGGVAAVGGFTAMLAAQQQQADAAANRRKERGDA